MFHSFILFNKRLVYCWQWKVCLSSSVCHVMPPDWWLLQWVHYSRLLGRTTVQCFKYLSNLGCFAAIRLSPMPLQPSVLPCSVFCRLVYQSFLSMQLTWEIFMHFIVGTNSKPTFVLLGTFSFLVMLPKVFLEFFDGYTFQAPVSAWAMSF